MKVSLCDYHVKKNVNGAIDAQYESIYDVLYVWFSEEK